MNRGCPDCGHDAALLQALSAALANDDVDAAIELGLLQFEPSAPIGENDCERCYTALDRVIGKRDSRRAALAARERYRLREARLARLAEARAAGRTASAHASATPQSPLSPAAAAALARAKAKAAERA